MSKLSYSQLALINYEKIWKIYKVIKSCKTMEQWEVAYNLWLRFFTDRFNHNLDLQIMLLNLEPVLIAKGKLIIIEQVKQEFATS